MTINFALEYIPKRMAELCLGSNYHIRLRHFVLQPSEQRILLLHDNLFLLVEPSVVIRIESDTGLYDANTILTNELQYEYLNDITITNLSNTEVGHVRFIQVIPKHCRPCQ